jgi:hypothetical protein
MTFSGSPAGRLRSCGPLAAFLVAAIVAALAPLFDRASDRAAIASVHFPGWPAHHDGRPLTQMPLTEREATFVRDFPGRVGRFSDGQHEIIMRWVDAPTRRLHPAADCFRGSGYAITPMPLRKDAAGAAMSCFRATHGTDALLVCELIRDERGESWPDVSAWYWSAMFGKAVGPWWSFVLAEPE